MTKRQNEIICLIPLQLVLDSECFSIDVNIASADKITMYCFATFIIMIDGSVAYYHV